MTRATHNVYYLVLRLKLVEPRLKLNMMVNLGLIGGISLRILSAEARIGLVAFEVGMHIT